MALRETSGEQPCVLVSGASGFLGRHLVAQLRALKRRVAALVRRPSFEGAIEEIIVTEWNAANLAMALKGRQFGWVFNLAAGGTHPGARDENELHRINVECAVALTEFSAGIRASHVHVGSSAEYGIDRPERLAEDAPLEQGRLYGRSKSLGTQNALLAARAVGLSFVAARLFGVYGPGEGPHRLLPTLVANLSRGQRVPLSPGDQVRDMMHVEDAAMGLIALAQAAEDCRGQHLANLCTGEGVPVCQFAEIAARNLDAGRDLLGFGDIPYRPDDIMHLVGDPARLHALTSWRPALSLEAGIARAVMQIQSMSSQAR